MSNSSSLTNIQEAVIATEVSLAKNYAIKSNNLVTEINAEVNILKNELYNTERNLNNVISKLQNLCNILSQGDFTNNNINPDNLKYENL